MGESGYIFMDGLREGVACTGRDGEGIAGKTPSIEEDFERWYQNII